MSKALDRADWRQLLPDVYHWIDQVKVSSSKDFSKSAPIVVSVKNEGEPKPKKIIASDAIAKDQKTKLTAAWEDSGWLGKGGENYTIGDQRYFFVAVGTIKTSEQQLARQFGMNVARIIKDF